MVLLLRKLYLYFTKDPEAVHYFPGGPTFFQGVQMPISHKRTCYFPGVSGPHIRLWIRAWAMSSKRDIIYHSLASNHNCQALICQD